MKIRSISLLLCIGILLSCLTAATVSASEIHKYTAAELEDLSGGIVAFKMSESGSTSIQNYIDTALCDAAGTTAEYYAMTLSQSGRYDFSRYEKALLAYLDTHEVYSATTREKYALALIACGSCDSYITEVCDNDIGGLGIMSLVFGLHLLNNGYKSSLYTVDSLINEVLSYQLSDGGWAVIGSLGDVDVTAMAVQALAPYCGGNKNVKSAIDSALELLSKRQLDSGGFKSMGVENCESSAQVLTALSSLGIDQSRDDRFIKSGNTVLSAMLAYRNADGSFAHTGSGFNENATIQAFYSLRAYIRMLQGKTPFYILDNRPSNTSGSTVKPDKKPTEAAGNNGGTSSDSGNGSGQSNDTVKNDEPASSVVAASERMTESSSVTEKTYPTEPYHGEYVAPTGTARFQPDGDDKSATGEALNNKGGYKLWAILGIVAAAFILSLILFILKKRNIKNYIAVTILAAAAVLFILLTDFESPAEYNKTDLKTNAVGTVTMTISCSVLNGEDDKPYYIPDDGIILPETVFSITGGDTVYDILIEASKTYNIQIDNRGSDTSAYIAGIRYLYEYEYGELSGWMYRVNGSFPDVGCQSYHLSDGDAVEWLYTKSIGKDL